MDFRKKYPSLAIILLLGVSILLPFLFWEYHKRSEAKALCEAVRRRDEVAMRELLKFRVSPDWKTFAGQTPRELAIQENCDLCLKLFRYYEYQDGGGLLSLIGG
jgi:hypothetical protein